MSPTVATSVPATPAATRIEAMKIISVEAETPLMSAPVLRRFGDAVFGDDFYATRRISVFYRECERLTRKPQAGVRVTRYVRAVGDHSVYEHARLVNAERRAAGVR